MCHDVWMTYDASWLDRTSAWWAKADRARHHLGSLDRLVAEFRASEPYTVVPRPTDALITCPGETGGRETVGSLWVVAEAGAVRWWSGQAAWMARVSRL
jgi:hypothetical protein